MKKKLLAMLLCASMLFTITACGDDKKDDTEKGSEIEIVDPKLIEMATFDNVDEILTGDYEVTDKIIEEGFANLLTSEKIGVVWTEVKDRDVVEENDIVNIDYTGYLNDKAFDGGSAKDQYISVKKNGGVDKSTGEVSGSFIEGFSDGLVGAKVGETVKHNVTFPKDYGVETLNGQQTTFEFKINGIYTFKAYTLDSIDDAFVKEKFEKGYELTTVEELKQYLTENLKYSALSAYIVDNSKFDITDEYLDYRVEIYLQYYNAMFQSYYGTTYEAYLKNYGYTIDDIKKGWEEGIESTIKYELVYEEIVKENNLEVDEEEIKEYILSNLGDDATEESLEEYYEYWGYGDAKKGKGYVLNETVARDFLLEKLGFETEE